MFTKINFNRRLIISIGGSSLGVLVMVLLLQCNAGKQPINITKPSQTPPDTQGQWVKPPSTIKTPQQSAKTNPSPSKKLENVPTTPDPSERIPALVDKEETIRSIVDSLSDEDIEELEGLTIRDFLSDEDLEKLDHKMVESLKEFVEIVPQIVEFKARVGEIMARNNNLAKQKNWHQDREKYEEVVKNNERINEMLKELRNLQSRASDLENFLLDSDFDSIGPERNKEWIRDLAKNIWNAKGWPPEFQPKDPEEQ